MQAWHRPLLNHTTSFPLIIETSARGWEGGLVPSLQGEQEGNREFLPGGGRAGLPLLAGLLAGLSTEMGFSGHREARASAGHISGAGMPSLGELVS